MVADSGGGTCRFAEHTGTSATAAMSQAGIPTLGGLSLTTTSREEEEAAGLGTGAEPRWAGGDLAAPQGWEHLHFTCCQMPAVQSREKAREWTG